MSLGLSLGVDHQMLADEYSPQAIDNSQALDDLTGRLAENILTDGNEALVMIAAHEPEAIPTNLELETLLHRVREAVLGYMGGHAGETSIQVTGMDEPVLDIGLEDYKQILVAAKDRVLKVIRWLAKNIIAVYKRLSDRLGRLSVRMMMIERKIDSSSDNALPTDTIVLPPSAAMLSLFAKKPANASEVMNAVNKVKWLFTTIHNDFNQFQNTFKRAVDAGNRADVLTIIQDFLGGLSGRLNARVDSQRNGRLVFNQLPNNYIVEISVGDSFTDCWATINRVGNFDVTGETSRRPDRASLSRLISELRNQLRVVNELYGKVGSRLTSDFRNLTREAERSLENPDSDNRTIEATINWFTEQQNRLFYRTMVLACGTMSAAMDYCVVALRAGQTGNESLDDLEVPEFGAANRLTDINEHFSKRQIAIDVAATGTAMLGAALESFDAGKYNPDFSVQKLLTADLSSVVQSGKPLEYMYWTWDHNDVADYPTNFIDILRRVDKGLNEFSHKQLNEFKTLLLARGRSDDMSMKVLKRHGYLGEAGYVQYLLDDGATPTSSAGVVEGAAVGVHTLIKLFAQFRKRTQLVGQALHDRDLIVSKLQSVIEPDSVAPMVDVLLTGGFGVQRTVNYVLGKPVEVARAYMNDDAVYRCDVPDCDADASLAAQELIMMLVEMDDDLAAHWGELNQIVQHTRSIQLILTDSMLKCNKGKADEWLMDGMRYLMMMYGEMSWQSRLLRDLLMYREALILALCFYQSTKNQDDPTGGVQ